MILCNDFKINNSSFVAPDAEVSVQKKDLEASDTGKDESGYLHRFLLRRKLRTWSFNYTHLTQEEYEYMEKLLDASGTFTFTFPDDNGSAATCTAYCAGGAVAIRNIKTGIYSRYSFNIVEC